MKNNTQTEPTDWEEIFDATFNYVAPCLKGNCHQGAHIYDEQGNCCELKDIKDFIRLQRLEAHKECEKYLKAHESARKACPACMEIIRLEAQKELLEEIEKWFKPAESTRGQGGLPIMGTVKDWEFYMTKDSWEEIKRAVFKTLE